MTRCTCLWSSGAGDAGRPALLLADPLCPAEALHARAAQPGPHVPEQGTRVPGGVLDPLDVLAELSRLDELDRMNPWDVPGHGRA